MLPRRSHPIIPKMNNQTVIWRRDIDDKNCLIEIDMEHYKQYGQLAARKLDLSKVLKAQDKNIKQEPLASRAAFETKAEALSTHALAASAPSQQISSNSEEEKTYLTTPGPSDRIKSKRLDAENVGFTQGLALSCEERTAAAVLTQFWLPLCLSVIYPVPAANSVVDRQEDRTQIHYSTPTSSKRRSKEAPKTNQLSRASDVRHSKDGFPFYNGKDLIIGPNGTTIPSVAWYGVDWEATAAQITRQVLMGVFGKDVLATHNLTGRPSPVFLHANKAEKKPLPRDKVEDVLYILTDILNVSEKEIRMAIVSKCADEAKLVPARQNRDMKQKNVL